MKDFSFGQFYPAKSFVHNLDARAKILITIAYIVAVFLVGQFQFMGFLACFIFVLVATIFSKVPFMKVLKSIKGIMILIIISLSNPLSFLYLVWPVGWTLSIATLLCFFFPTVKKLEREVQSPGQETLKEAKN